MNYSYNGFSPYGLYGSVPNTSPYQSTQMNGQYSNQNQNMNQMNQVPQQNVNNQIQRYLPFTYVNGVVGAKAFLVFPNQKFYLMDAEKDVLYEKSSDSVGKPELKAWELKPISLEEVENGKPNIVENNVQPIINTDDFVNKKQLEEQILSLETLFDTKIDKVMNKIEKLAKTQISSSKSKESE